MIDSKGKMKPVVMVGDQLEVGLPENIPILAYSADVHSSSEIQTNVMNGANEDCYANQVSQEHMNSNVKLSHPSNISMAQRRLTGNSSG